jgi:hypothetical protein
MHLEDTLAAHSEEIVSKAAMEIVRKELEHYESIGPTALGNRLRTLLECVIQSVRKRRTEGVHFTAEAIARQRFQSDYPEEEVVEAIRALENAAWDCVLLDVLPRKLASALVALNLTFGAARDGVERAYRRGLARSEGPEDGPRWGVNHVASEL